MREVVHRMLEYAYPFAEIKGVHLNFDAEETVQKLLLTMDMRKNIYLIFKEALNNAFKYASASNISISITKQGGLLHMEIKDDGKGFDLINQRKGNGLNNMQKRAEQVSGTLTITSGKGEGTMIHFICPVS